MISATTSRARSLITGLALLALALATLAVALSPAVADEDVEGLAEQDGDEALEDEDADDDVHAPAEDETQDLEVSESALYAYPVTDALPPTLTDSIPPQAVCVVQPDLCPEELRPLTEAVTGAIDTVQEEAEVSPVQPVPEGAVAVGYFAGFERYESAVKFELPDIPDGEEVVSFRVSFPMEQPSYDLNSPMFRDVATAAMVAIGDSDPGVIAERLPEILAESEPIEINSDRIRMEACPLTEPFEPGGAPQAQHSDEMPRHETDDENELGEVAVDCMLGGSGTLDEDGERWVFDLAFAADAWVSGELDNQGILLRPVGVPNAAYGDPDVTTNAQISVGLDDVTVAMDTAEPPPPVEDLDDAPSLEAGGEPMESDQLSMEDDGGSFDGGVDAGGSDGFDEGAADSPEVADDPGADAGEAVDEPEVAASPGLDQAEQAGFGGGAPWWVWLLVPAFAGGAYLVGNAMTASPLSVAAGGDRPGAMSRLVAQRGHGGLST